MNRPAFQFLAKVVTISFHFGTDQNNAHVQPDGQYHYHGMPEGFIAKRGGNSSTMTLIGWAAVQHGDRIGALTALVVALPAEALVLERRTEPPGPRDPLLVADGQEEVEHASRPNI